MLERIHFDSTTSYDVVESTIHLNRYYITKNLCKNKVVLDAACGEGYGSYLLSQWGASKVYGVDISEDAIRNAKNNFKTDNITFSVDNVEYLDTISDNSIDLVISFETMEHISHINNFFNNIKRVLKPNGLLIISCPNDWWYFPNENEKNPYHIRKYTYEEFMTITSKFFGKPEISMIAHRIEGFANFIQNDWNIIGKNQLDMLNYKAISSSILPPEQKLDPNTCNYFVNIWNYSSEFLPDLTCSSTFPSLQPMEMDLRNMLSDAKKQLEKKDTEWQSMLDELNQNLFEQNSFYQKEINYIKQENIQNQRILNSKLRKLELKEDFYKNENHELKIKLEQLEQKYSNIQKEHNKASLILDEIYRSKAWKLIQKYYNFMDKFRKIS